MLGVAGMHYFQQVKKIRNKSFNSKAHNKLQKTKALS